MKNCKILAIFIITTFLINYLAVPILAIENINEDTSKIEQEVKQEFLKANDKDEIDTVQKNDVQTDYAEKTTELKNNESTNVAEKLELPKDYHYTYTYVGVSPDGSGEYFTETTEKGNSSILKIIKHNFETKNFETVNTFNYNNKLNAGRHFYNKKNAYILLYDVYKKEKPELIEYNKENNTFSYNKTYANLQSIYFGQYFAVDNQKNIYVGYEDTSGDTKKYFLKVVDLNDNEISNYEIDKSFAVYNISPDGRILIISYNESDAFLVMENGIVKSPKLQTMRSLIGSSRSSTYLFLEDNYAIDNFGELIRFSVNEENKITMNLEYKMNGKLDTDCVCQVGNYYYIALNSGLIVKYNSKTKSIEKSYEAEKPDKCISLGYNNNTLYFKYRVLNDEYLLMISENELNSTQKYTHTSNTASKHTKEEIIQKYNDAAIKTDSSNLYESQPSKVNPYKAGALSDSAKNDTINQINFYRWLYGIKEIPIKEDRLERNQKGAVLMAANKDLSHSPSKPSDMDQEFYNEAELGCSAQSDYTGNIAGNTDSVASAVYQWIDDSGNISQGSIGHRESVLGLNATSASFGYCDNYSTLSMYKDNSKLVSEENKDTFYAYPSPGYFPIEAIGSKAYWSITFPASDYNFNGSRMKLKVGNVENYVSGYLDTNFKYITTYFMITSSIAQQIVNGSKLKNGQTVEVDLTGIHDKYGNEHEFKYTINLFAINDIKADAIQYAITTGKTTKASWSRMTEASLDVGYTGYLRSQVKPENATEQEVKVRILNNDNNIVTYDDETKKITANKNGTVYVNMTVGSAITNFSLKIGTGVDSETIEAEEIKLNKEMVTLGIGQSENLIASILPENTQVKELEFWFSTNESIVKMKDGKITGVKEGTAKVGAKTYNGKIAYCTVNVVTKPTVSKGDVNGDGRINAGDYVAVLNYVRKKINLTEEQLQRADVNVDGKVNAGDYVTILNIVRGKI